MRALPLPTRDGVGPSCTALPVGPWPTIAEFLIERFAAIPRATWEARMDAREVVDEHGVPVSAERPYEPRLRVYYYRSLEAEARIPFDELILSQDAHLLVVDKPHFLPVAPVGKYVQESLLVRLKRTLGLDQLAPLHRIDRETAGIVLFSVQPATRGAYHALFAQRAITKHYEAIVPWREGQVLPAVHRSRMAPDDHFMRMREVPGEPNAETHLALLEQRGAWARLQLSPVTGRRHQLRVHCAALGMPILNDAIYPTLRAEGGEDFSRPLQLLARELAFRDPVSGAERRFASTRALQLPHDGLRPKS
ncbi:Ribosomal large subunit pseudouridine synthase A [Variovorax sp. SRS16]|uniref:pseudouridine synthase n=1 Tax=Variovorax sp. SRS16 TaxID=282217 RepID=UPI0013168EDD|nr:pseudouridine synthase [Variovorax sp. SRS16]VTU30312.1 Ribosomal large subunit pseudouridine synthase A [Variovorax sp. SRS16]